MLDEKKAAIANYVLNQHDHDSLRLAIDIHDAFDAIRVRVIQEFTQKIVQYLINELPSEKRWLIYPKRLLEKPLEIYTNLIVRRDIWCNDLEVRIEAQSSGANNWIIGVWKNENYHNFDLIGRLTKEFGAGRSSQTCLWFQYFGERTKFGLPEMRNWSAGAAIIAMREGVLGDYGKRVCEGIIKIANVVDSLPQT